MSQPTAQALTWAEVKQAAAELFNIFVDKREFVWAEEAWQILVDTKLPIYTNEYGRCRAGLYLLSLASLYADFCWLACDIQEWPNYPNAADSLGISHFRMGQIVATDPDFLNDHDGYDGIYYTALETYAKRLRSSVYAALQNAYEEPLQFAYALWKTVEVDDEPLAIAPQDEEWYFMHAVIPASQIRVYEWITNGCYLVH